MRDRVHRQESCERDRAAVAAGRQTEVGQAEVVYEAPELQRLGDAGDLTAGSASNDTADLKCFYY